MTQPRFLSFGELFLDFFALPESDTGSSAGIDCYKRYAGGAPANVAVVLATLGENSFFVGKTGKDMLGDFLVQELKKHRVHTDLCYQDANMTTSLAFVSHDNSGERHFQFYRDSRTSADLSFDENQWQDEWFASSAFLHCGSNCQVTASSHAATLAGMQMARKHSVAVSYDPNLRPFLWKDEEEMIRRIHALFPYADLVKLSEDEMHRLFPSLSEEDAVGSLFSQGCSLVVITRGSEGCCGYLPDGEKVKIAPCICATVDTTGAGDTLVASLMRMLARSDFPKGLTVEQLREALTFANRAAALSTTRKGAFLSAPTLREVEEFCP